MARPRPDLSRFDKATIEAAIATHGVMRGAQQLQISYRHLTALREAFAIPRQACYGMQRQVLLALKACPGATLRELRTWINAHHDRPRFRQAIWEACRKLLKEQLIRKDGSGLAARYWLVEGDTTHGSSPCVD